jgi:mannosyltransferase OCH1-like enzyme
MGLCIPKRFIRIWLGEKEIPEMFEKWWNEFIDIHSGYEFMTITDKSVKDKVVTIPYYLEPLFKSVSTLAGQSDILRLVLLYELGGIYVDTDVMPLKSFDPLVVSATKPFIAKRSSKSFESAVIGSPSKHQAVSDLLKALPKWFNDHIDRSASVQTGPAFISNFWFGRPDVTHLPSTAFYPYNGFGAPKRDEKTKMFDERQFSKSMYAAHFSNHRWGGKPKSGE